LLKIPLDPYSFDIAFEREIVTEGIEKERRKIREIRIRPCR